jgi:serine/threonine protein kinase
MRRFAQAAVRYALLSRATEGFAPKLQIGSGATGSVFRGTVSMRGPEPALLVGWNMEADLQIAVKQLSLGDGATPEARRELRRRFDAEVSVLRMYEHPRVVRVLSHGVCSDVSSRKPFVIAFEYLDGGSLDHWLRGPKGEAPRRTFSRGGGSLPAPMLLDIAIGAGVGLAFLHGSREPGGAGGGGGSLAPVLHRDVKSANVGLALQGDQMFAKILDCGLAKVVVGPAATGVSFTCGLAGTRGYMAPELVRVEYTTASEIYSFGVVLLELLTGRCVSHDTVYNVRRAAMDEKHRRSRVVADVVSLADKEVWPSAAAEELAKLVLDCSEEDPADRPADMGIVLARLRVLRGLFDSELTVAVMCCVTCKEKKAESDCIRAASGALVCFGCVCRPGLDRLSAELQHVRADVIENTRLAVLALRCARRTPRALVPAHVHVLLDERGCETNRGHAMLADSQTEELERLERSLEALERKFAAMRGAT